MDRRGPHSRSRLSLPRDDRVTVRPAHGGHLTAYERTSARRRRVVRLARTLTVAVVLVAACGVVAWWRLAPRGTDTPAATASTPAGVRIVSGTFLGDDGHSAYGGGPAPRTLDLKWKLKIGQGWTRRKIDEKPVLWAGTGWTGQCTLVEDGGRRWLVIGCFDHRLRKIDADTGKVAWSYAFDDVIKATNTVFVNPRPTSETDRLIVVSGSRRGSSYAVGDPRIAPLRAVSFATGRELWRLPVPKTDNYSQDVDSSPLLIGGALYAPIESGYVYRVDPSRTTTWGAFRAPVVLGRSPRLYTVFDAMRHPDGASYNVAIEASPARIGDRLYIASGAGHLFGLRLPDLAIVWDFKTGSDLDGTTVVTADHKLLLPVERQYIKGPGGVFLLDPSKAATASPVWYFPTLNRGYSEWEGGVIGSVATNERGDAAGKRPRLAAFLSVDGNLYVTALDAVSTRRGFGPDRTTRYPAPVEVFRDAIGGSISTPVIVGDTIVAASSEKRVRLYRIEYLPPEATEGVSLSAPDGSRWRVRIRRTAEFATAGPVESTPLVYGGRVFIGCRDGYLYCLGDS